MQQELKPYNKISVDGRSKNNSTAHDSGYITATNMGGFSAACMNKSIRAGEMNVNET